MKTKRRHELQTNKLADWLGNKIEVLKPYWNYIIAGAIGVVALMAFVMYMAANQRDRASLAWGDYFSAIGEQSPDALESVPKSHPNTVASLWALQSAGDIQLREGTRLIYTHREDGIKSLEAAQASFEKVVNNSKTPPKMLLQRSQYALAQTLETLGKLDEAQEMYSTIEPSSVIGQMAAEDLRRLADPDTALFYAALEKGYTPPKFEPEDPLVDFPDVPRRPDFSFPGDEEFLTVGSDDDDADDTGVKKDDDNSFDTNTNDAKKSDDDSSADDDKKDSTEDSSKKDGGGGNEKEASKKDADKKSESKEKD